MKSLSPLRVERRSLLQGAREAKGVAVVIDVLRAFTSAAMMFYLGAEKIILVAEPEEALRLKQDHRYLAVGEVDGRTVHGFDLGNSPARVLAAGRELFKGRTVVQRTSAGVTGAVAAARRAELVILGSYVTAAATARYVRDLDPPPDVVSLIAMGAAGVEVTPDDEACADYLAHLLAGLPYDHAAALQSVVEHECTRKFLRGDQDHFPPQDAVYCLQRDLFGFVILASMQDGLLTARQKHVET